MWQAVAGRSTEGGSMAPLPNVDGLELFFEGVEVDRLENEMDHAFDVALGRAVTSPIRISPKGRVLVSRGCLPSGLFALAHRLGRHQPLGEGAVRAAFSRNRPSSPDSKAGRRDERLGAGSANPAVNQRG